MWNVKMRKPPELDAYEQVAYRTTITALMLGA